MKPNITWDWLRTKSDGETPQPAHLCVVLPDKRAVAVCNHPFLTTVERVEGSKDPNSTFPKCEECLTIWKSGNEIAITDDSNQKIVVRPKLPEGYSGSLDPFQDVAENLGKMGVAFFLVIGIPKKPELRYWTNLPNFGAANVAEAKRQIRGMLHTVEEKAKMVDKKRADDAK
jgi:hypothetical protein